MFITIYQLQSESWIRKWKKITLSVPQTNISPLTFLAWYRHLNEKKRGGVKPVLWNKSSTLGEMMRSCKSFQHLRKIPTLRYNRANTVSINNVIILNIIHNKFNFCYTEVVICIILVLLKKKGSMAPTIIWIVDNIQGHYKTHNCEKIVKFEQKSNQSQSRWRQCQSRWRQFRSCWENINHMDDNVRHIETMSITWTIMSVILRQCQWRWR